MREGNCIVSFGCNDYRYLSGLKRLHKSLDDIGYQDYFWHRWADNYAKHIEIPYYFKTAILSTLRDEKNYKNLLWLDSSFYAIKKPDELFKKIDEQGWYFSESGYNCAQSVNDECLKRFGISRDEAEGIKEVSSGCVGINLDTEIGKEILRLWKMYTEFGCTKGSRFHDNQSSDPRFLFHRQDQSVLSLCAHQLGLIPGKMGEYWDYYTDEDIKKQRKLSETCSFICRGM